MGAENLEKHFGAADFAVFFAMLIISAVIGIFFGYRDRKKKSIDTYYYGDHNISPFAVAMSMAVSFVSAITIIGYPVEAYMYGISILWMIPATFLSTTIGAIYHIPLIFRLKLKSIYEYLELRYSRTVRRFCSGVVMAQAIIYMGITVYIPALALDSVTPLDLRWSIALTSIICTFYTALGGIKAVIWTDVLQGFIMIFGSLALFVKTTMMAGGIENVMTVAERGGRLNLLKYSSDMRERTSLVSFGLCFGILSASGLCSQVFAQRYLSCKSVGNARKAAFIRLVPITLFMALALADGIAMYAYYERCDPMEAGYISKQDQATPYLAVDVFQDIPGLAGLFVSAAYSGTLSTVSSGINSLAAMTTEDFITPKWPNITDMKKSMVAKVVSLFFGACVMGIAYIIPLFQSTVIQVSMSIAGITVGPIVSVFAMGMFFPWTNTKGALTGMFIGWGVCLWWSLGRIIYGAAPEFIQSLPVSVEGCVTNFTSGSGSQIYSTATTELEPYRPPLADTLYSISPFLYGFFGFSIGCVTMIIASGLTGFNKAKNANPDLFIPLIDNKKIFPEGVIKFFRFGVPERKDNITQNGEKEAE